MTCIITHTTQFSTVCARFTLETFKSSAHILQRSGKNHTKETV